MQLNGALRHVRQRQHLIAYRQPKGARHEKAQHADGMRVGQYHILGLVGFHRRCAGHALDVIDLAEHAEDQFVRALKGHPLRLIGEALAKRERRPVGDRLQKLCDVAYDV